MSFNNKIKSLIDQNMSPKDKAQMQDWLAEAEASMENLKSTKSLESITDSMQGYKAYDKNSAFEKITNESLEDNVKSINWKPFVAAAAAVAIVVIGFFLFNNSNNFQKSEFASLDTELSKTLYDQSIVTLDKNSKVISTSERSVIAKGRAFFKVKSTNDKKSFTVQLEKGMVTVLGTEFSVVSQENINEVVVREGKVKYQYKDKELILTAGMGAAVINDQLIALDGLSNNGLSWVNHKLEFNDTPLKTAIDDISRHYNVDITFDKSVNVSSTCVLTTKIQNENIDDMMLILKTLFHANYHKVGKSIVITSIRC